MTEVPYTLVSAAEVSHWPATTSAQFPPLSRYWYFAAVPEGTEKLLPAWMSNCPEPPWSSMLADPVATPGDFRLVAVADTVGVQYKPLLALIT